MTCRSSPPAVRDTLGAVVSNGPKTKESLSARGLGVRVASSGEGYEVYSLRTGALICHVDDPARAGLPTTPTQGVDWKTLAAQFAAPTVGFHDQ